MDWNNTHENLEIMGFPVELYVQDISADTESTAIYDLEENEWVKEPSQDEFEPIGDKRQKIKVIASKIMTKIDDMTEYFNTQTDSHKIEKLGGSVQSLLDKIMDYRKKYL